MFGGKKGTEANSANPVQVATIIGPNAMIKGVLSSSEPIRIDGEVEGEISCTAEVIVGQTGQVRATISARTAIIAGSVNGNMIVSEKLEVLSSAKLVGDLQAGALVIAEGAVFKGNCGMKN